MIERVFQVINIFDKMPKVDFEFTSEQLSEPSPKYRPISEMT